MMGLGIRALILFHKTGTDEKAMKQYFIDNGAEEVEIGYDWITDENDKPLDDQLVYYVNMSYGKFIKCKLELNLHEDRQNKGIYWCLEG